MSESLSGSGVYVLLSDGTTALIRQATPDDFVAVKTMHEEMSPANAYLRFFSLSRTAPEREARRISRKPDDDHAALLAIYSGQVVGVASYEATRGEGSASPTASPRPTEPDPPPGGSGMVISTVPSARRVRTGSPASLNTRSIPVFSLRVSAVNAVICRARASDTRCSSSRVAMPR